MIFPDPATISWFAILTNVTRLASSSAAAIAHELRIATTRTTRRLRSVTKRSITLTQLSALSSIQTAGELTLGELAARERVQPPSMTRVIATLCQEGLVERNTHPTDGRQVLVSLTEHGTTMLAAEAKAREAWLARQLSKLTKEEREILRGASAILVRLIDE